MNRRTKRLEMNHRVRMTRSRDEGNKSGENASGSASYIISMTDSKSCFYIGIIINTNSSNNNKLKQQQ